MHNATDHAGLSSPTITPKRSANPRTRTPLPLPDAREDPHCRSFIRLPLCSFRTPLLQMGSQGRQVELNAFSGTTVACALDNPSVWCYRELTFAQSRTEVPMAGEIARGPTWSRECARIVTENGAGPESRRIRAWGIQYLIGYSQPGYALRSSLRRATGVTLTDNRWQRLSRLPAGSTSLRLAPATRR